MTAPTVSILIPTFNRAHWLGQAIDGALAQNYPHLETLVLDNASGDETPSVVQRYAGDTRLRYIRNAENIGMVRNWCSGIETHARGDWFLLLSDDDFLDDPCYISKAMALAAQDPDVVLVYANGWILDQATGLRSELRLPFGAINEGRTIFMSRDGVPPQDFTLCNVLFQRALAIEEGAFQNPGNLSCDSELFLRMCLRGKVAVCHDLVSTYRWHSGNLISRVQLDYDFLINNLDMYVQPLRRAVELGALTPQDIEGWRSGKLGGAIKWTLKTVRKHHRERLAETLLHLKQHVGPNFGRLLPFRQRIYLVRDQLNLWLSSLAR